MTDKKTRKLQFRRDLDVEQIKEEDGVFEIAFSSEAPVKREIMDQNWNPIEVNEILLHDSPDNADLTRLNNSAALLFNHDFDKHIGIVVPGTARIDEDHKGRAKVKFSQYGALAQEIGAKVKEGTILKISFGYDVDEYELRAEDLLVTKWTPYEISFVTIPADDTVGVGRSINKNVKQIQIKKETRMAKRIDEMSVEELRDMSIEDIEALSDEERTKREEAIAKEAEGTETREEETETTESEDELTPEEFEEEIEEIEEIAERYKVDRGDVRKAIANKMTARQFKRSIKPAKTTTVIRSMKDTKETLETKFDLGNVMRSLMNGTQLNGAEAEYHQEMSRKALQRGAVAHGVHIPVSALRAAPGGNTSGSLNDIKQDIVRYDSFVELLLGPSIVDRLGINVLSGLENPITIPGMTKSSVDSFGFVGENDESPEGEAKFNNIHMTPHTFTGGNPLSRQALLTMPNLQGFISDHIVKFSRAKLESLLFGSVDGGFNAPKSIVSQLTAQDSGYSYKEFMKLAAGLIDSGVDAASLKYVMNGTLEADLMSTLRDANVSNYIVTDDHKLGGYDVVASGRVAADKVIMGDFSGVTIAEWRGLSLDIDDTTYRNRGAVVPRIWCDMDWAVSDVQKLKLLQKTAPAGK